MTTPPLEHVVDLIELDSELRETVVATFVWDGTSEVRVEADDEEDVEELSLVVRRGIPAFDEPPRLVTGRDGLAFLEALRGAYAGSRCYASEVRTRPAGEGGPEGETVRYYRSQALIPGEELTPDEARERATVVALLHREGRPHRLEVRGPRGVEEVVYLRASPPDEELLVFHRRRYPGLPFDARVEGPDAAGAEVHAHDADGALRSVTRETLDDAGHVVLETVEGPDGRFLSSRRYLLDGDGELLRIEDMDAEGRVLVEDFGDGDRDDEPIPATRPVTARTTPMARHAGPGGPRLDDVPEDQRATSPDGTRIAGWWIASERGGHEEDETVYRIAVWKAATGEPTDSYTRVHREDHRTGDARGKPVAGVEWTPDGELLVVHGDGSREPAR